MTLEMSLTAVVIGLFGGWLASVVMKRKLWRAHA